MERATENALSVISDWEFGIRRVVFFFFFCHFAPEPVMTSLLLFYGS